jgi:hypothetical protein
MIEVMRTTNPADINYIQALLKEADIFFAIFDENISIVEGSIGLFPKRVMISEYDSEAVHSLLQGSGLESALLPQFRSAAPEAGDQNER